MTNPFIYTFIYTKSITKSNKHAIILIDVQHIPETISDKMNQFYSNSLVYLSDLLC